jgi:hypothetical protein
MIGQEEILRRTILETLSPEEEKIVGEICDCPSLQEIGFWVDLIDTPCFFGPTFQSALLTAKIGDWVNPRRDGDLTGTLIEWFDFRARNVNWEEIESSIERLSRRSRTEKNLELGITEIEYHSYQNVADQEKTKVNPLEQKKMAIEKDPTVEKLKEIEIFQIEDQTGYWLLEDSLEEISEVRFFMDKTGWFLTKKNTKEASLHKKFHTVIKIKIDPEGHIYQLKLYDSYNKEILHIKRVKGEIQFPRILVE